MSNLGFNHAMGAAKMQSYLGEFEGKRREDQTAMERENAKVQGQAIGSLIGTGVGMIKGGYDAYKQDQVDQDVERGIQARKEYGVMTDQSKHFDDRLNTVYGNEGAEDIKDALYRRMGDAKKNGVMDALRQRSGKVKAGIKGQTMPSRAAMNELTQLKPRISQTNVGEGIANSADTPIMRSGANTLVSNSPWRDFHAASKFFDDLIGD